MTDTYQVRETSVRDKALWSNGVDHGKDLEQSRIIKLIRLNICFEFNTGDCEHQACYNNASIIRQIRGMY
jgi:hypothetical protein